MRAISITYLIITLLLGALLGFATAEVLPIASSLPKEIANFCALDEEVDPQGKARFGHSEEALSKQIVEARSDAHRYREGLKRAVEELNRLSKECLYRADSPPPAVIRDVPPIRKVETRSRLRLKGPKLQPWEDDLVAFGTVQNPGNEEESGVVVLDLLHDGRVIDHEVISIYVSAGDEVAFEHTFWAGKLEGQYRVRGRLES